MPSPLLIRILGNRRAAGPPEPAKKRDWWDRADIVGKIAPGFLAVAVSGLAVLFSLQANHAVQVLNQRQEDINLLNLQNNSLMNLADADGVKKTLGEIALARYGKNVLPILSVLLNGADPKGRVSGLETAEYVCLFSAQTTGPEGEPTGNATEAKRLRENVTSIAKASLEDNRFEITDDVKSALERLCRRLVEPANVHGITQALVNRFQNYANGERSDLPSLQKALEFFQTQPSCCSTFVLSLLMQPSLGPGVWNVALDSLNEDILKGGTPLRDLETWRTELAGAGHLRQYRNYTLTLANLGEAIRNAGGKL